MHLIERWETLEDDQSAFREITAVIQQGIEKVRNANVSQV